MRVLPYRAALLLGWIIASLSFHVFRFRVRAALTRIRQVFGAGMSDAEARRIAWRSWRNFVFSLVDMCRVSLINMEWVARHVVDYEQAQRTVRDHCGTGKGVILGCPHMGAWETAGVIMQVFGMPVFYITGRQKNPLVDAYLNRMRGITGIPTVSRGSSLLRSVARRLRNGEMLAFLPDVRSSAEAEVIEFLGGTANVVGGMGLFARLAGVPVFPSIVTRVGWTRHRIEFREPVWPDERLDKGVDRQRITQEVFRSIEQAIREHPDQWFWFNKRWILDPV